MVNIFSKKRPHGLVVAGSGSELTNSQKVSFIPLQISRFITGPKPKNTTLVSKFCSYDPKTK
jgi:hypothetical protein